MRSKTQCIGTDTETKELTGDEWMNGPHCFRDSEKIGIKETKLRSFAAKALTR